MFVRPFAVDLDFTTGRFVPNDRVNVRRLSDMRGMFFDREAETRLRENGDPVVYSFSERRLPEENGQLQLAATSINPGRVGAEYFMTKGHYHSRLDTAEVYLGLHGEGCLLMQTGQGDFQSIAIRPGVMAYIPPCWGHRMANTGSVPFVFFAVYPGDAGHNYGAIEQTGFVRLLVEQDGKPHLIDNPAWGARTRP